MGLRPVLLLAVAAGLAAAAPVNLSGTWKLDPKASSWGNKDRPKSVLLTIEHQEPKLRISGLVVENDERTNNFAFDGAIDGKDYPSAEGRRMYRRLDDRTLESTFQSNDGRYSEKSITRISRDGRRLTREIEVTRPDGRLKWTEVYRKQG